MRGWTDAELGVLRRLGDRNCADALAAVLGRNAEDVAERCAALGLACARRAGAAPRPRAPEAKASSRSKPGRRADLGGVYFRSRWEANYARHLNALVRAGALSGWLYEPCTFWFDAIKRGTRSYTPDFELLYPDGRREFHEVKGWMDATSATRLKRMARYWPELPVRVVGPEWFAAARRSGLAAATPGWERG